MLKGTCWLLLLAFLAVPAFAQEKGADEDKPAAYEAGKKPEGYGKDEPKDEYGKKEEPKKPEPKSSPWKVKVVTPTTVTRPRIGYVMVMAEHERKVCKACLVCTQNANNCCVYCQKHWEVVTEVYHVPALVRQDVPPLEVLTSKVEEFDIPPGAAVYPKK